MKSHRITLAWLALPLALAACGGSVGTSPPLLTSTGTDGAPAEGEASGGDAGTSLEDAADAAAPAPYVTDPASTHGWFANGSDPSDYDMGPDPSITLDGKAVAHIQSRGTGKTGFGTWMAVVPGLDAQRLRGHRIRYTAKVKSSGVTDWSGLWMRIDGKLDVDSGMAATLAFDNMQDRPITGTSDWASYSIVLDAPSNFTDIMFGVLLSGDGEVWMGPATIEVVDKSVPKTG